MGLIDSFLDKTITLEVPDQDGNLVKRKISKKKFDQLIENRTIVKPNMVKSHILSPGSGYTTEDWLIGKDISMDEVEYIATDSLEIYVLIYYSDGKPETLLVTKNVWDKQKNIYEMIDRGEDPQEAQNSLAKEMEKSEKPQIIKRSSQQ
ncbi:MAG: hypothetical protein WC799_25370 [Desulfobacteraceae bacterium]|jgi:hypothetical protein